MAPSLTQAVGASGTTAATVTVAKPATGALLVVWLASTQASGHISAVTVTDNGSNAGWTVNGPQQVAGTQDMYMAFRVATATDHSSMTTVSWSYTGTTTVTQMEFDEYATGFVGTPTLSGLGVYGNAPGSASAASIQPASALSSGHLASGELLVVGISWNNTTSAFSWTTNANPPFPAPTTTGGSPLGTRLQTGFAVSNGAWIYTNTVQANWTTARNSAVFGATFYDPMAATSGMLTVM